ncbi:hypothetical protein ACHAWF_008868, partial [Thalassiosira exigua]
RVDSVRRASAGGPGGGRARRGARRAHRGSGGDLAFAALLLSAAASTRAAPGAAAAREVREDGPATSVRARDRPRGDCPGGSGRPWPRAVGAALLFNVAASLSATTVSAMKSRWVGRSTLEPFVSGASSLFLAVASGLLLRAEAKEADGDISTVGPTAICGFLIPLLASKWNFNRSKGGDEAEETSTVADEEDCLSCDTCRPGCGNGNDSALKSSGFVPPSYIDLQSRVDVSDRIDQDTVEMIGMEGESNPHGRRLYLFLHGAFIGAAILSFSGVETFILVGVASLLHLVHLGGHDGVGSSVPNLSPARNWFRDAILGSLLCVGGALAALFLLHEVANLLLAFAGGFYLSVALGMVVPVANQWMKALRSSVPEPSPFRKANRSPRQSAKASRQAIRGFYQNQAHGAVYCTPCSETPPLLRKTSSDITPIPMSDHPTQSDPGQHSQLVEHYNYATWSMYARIMSAREARAKCGICMGSMEEDEATALVVKPANKVKGAAGSKTISKSEEEHRLIATCPSPLFAESNERGEGGGSGVRETADALRVHRDCLYGAMVERPCPHKKALAESMIFQLDW